MAKIFYGNGICNIEGSYDVRGVEIRYRGSINAVKTCGDFAEIMVSSNKILAVSLGTGNLSKLFAYVGDLKIISVKVVDSNAEIIPTTFKRVMDYSELMDTNAEDMTTKSENLNTGYTNKNRLSRSGRIPGSVIKHPHPVSWLADEQMTGEAISLRGDPYDYLISGATVHPNLMFMPPECPPGTHMDGDDECRPDLFYHSATTQQAAYFIGEVMIDTLPVLSDDWVGVFNTETDVCVGAARWDISHCGGGICSINVMGEDFAPNGELYEWSEGYMNEGDIPYFKIWQASSGEYLDAIVSEHGHGHSDTHVHGHHWQEWEFFGWEEPVHVPPWSNLGFFGFQHLYTYTFDVPEGWKMQHITLWGQEETWITLNLQGLDHGIEKVMATVNLTVGDYVMSENELSVYYGPIYGWQGSIMWMDPGKMYKIYVEADLPSYAPAGSASLSNSLHFSGLPLDPLDYPMVLHEGWNWVGYPLQEPLFIPQWYTAYGHALINLDKTTAGFNNFGQYNGISGESDVVQGQIHHRTMAIPEGWTDIHETVWSVHPHTYLQSDGEWVCYEDHCVYEPSSAFHQHWTLAFEDYDGDGLIDSMDTQNHLEGVLEEMLPGRGYMMYIGKAQIAHWGPNKYDPTSGKGPVGKDELPIEQFPDVPPEY